MKNISIYIALISSFYLFSYQLNAQSNLLIIENNTGENFKVDLKNLSKITFNSSDFIVSKSNSEPSISIPIFNIRSLSFSEDLEASITSVEIDKINEMKIVPNPVNDKFSLFFESKNEQIAKIKIITIQGKIIYQESLPTLKGENQLVLNSQDYPSGFYMCNVELGSEIKNLNFIKN